MAEEKEDFSAVTNNNDRNNFFALQEVWPALFRQFAAAAAAQATSLLSPSLPPSLELHTYFSGAVAVQWRLLRSAITI